MISRPLTRDEVRMFQQEEAEELPELKPRPKEKPSWMNRRGKQAKHNHLVKRKASARWVQPQQDWTSKGTDWNKWHGEWSWEKVSWEDRGHKSHEWDGWQDWDAWDGWQEWGTQSSQPSTSTCAPVTPPKAPPSVRPRNSLEVCSNDFGGGPVRATTRESVLEAENAQLRRQVESLTTQVVELRRATMPTGDTDDSSLEGLDGDEQPEGISSLDAMECKAWDGYEEVEVTVDSGSAVSGLPEDLGQWVPLLKPAGEEKPYASASNHAVKVVGFRQPTFYFEPGLERRVRMTVLSPLKKPIFSTAAMTKAGMKVVHDSEANGGSYILDRKSGACIPLYEKGGVYKVRVWIKGMEPDSGFLGQASMP